MMNNTSTQNEISSTQIVLIFVLIGVLAAGIPLVLRAFGTYVVEATASQNAMNERIAEYSAISPLVSDDDAEGAQPTSPPADASPGLIIFNNNGCNGCHSLDGTVMVGPSLQGLSDRAGSTVSGLSAEEYVRQSIVAPNAHIVEGFAENIMPQTYEQSFSEEDISDLVDYLLEQ